MPDEQIAPVVPPINSDGGGGPVDPDDLQQQQPEQPTDEPQPTLPPGYPTTGLNGGLPIPGHYDIRNSGMFPPALRPYGTTFGIDITEVLRRGYKNLTLDEQATVAAGYLATQSQILSPFDTDEEVAEKKERLRMEADSHRTGNIMRFVMFGLVILVILSIIGLVIYFASKGILNDTGLLHGVITLLQDVFKVIFNGGKY